jgi:hypothetical protein
MARYFKKIKRNMRNVSSVLVKGEHSTDILIVGQEDANGFNLFYFTAKITLHVSGVSNTHHQEYIKQ